MNKTSNKVTIIIDESGTLPDPDDAVIVVAAVGAFDLMVYTLRSCRSVTI